MRQLGSPSSAAAAPVVEKSSWVKLQEMLQYYLVELQLLTPLALIGFALATLAFIITDVVKEHDELRVEDQVTAVFEISRLSITLPDLFTRSRSTFAATAVTSIASAASLPGLKSYASTMKQAQYAASLGDLISVRDAFIGVHLALLSSLRNKDDELRAAETVLFGVIRNLHLTQEMASGQLQPENAMSSSRALTAAGSNLLCTPHMMPFLSVFAPGLNSVLFCDSVAMNTAINGAGIQTGLNPNSFNGDEPVIDQLHELNGAYLEFLENAQSDYLSTFRDYRGYAKRIAILAVIFVLSSVGAGLSILLVLSQYRSLHEQFVVESDFHCSAKRVKIQSSTLRMVDELASRIGVMSPLPHGIASEISGNQIELHLRRAVEPLTMLRPFVPNFMYMGHMRGMSVANTTTSALLRSGEMLNLQLGLKKKPTAILFVGLRTFNEPDADLDLLNELMGAVHLSCLHFHGIIVQFSSEGIVAMFSRSTINEDENDERVEDGEVLAVHAAMGIYEICSSPMTQSDGFVREPFPVSMAVLSDVSYQGILQYHVSKQFGLLSPAIAHAIAIEPLNDIHSTSIVTSSATNNLISDHFITRPVHYVNGVGSVYHVIAAMPSEDDPNRDAIQKEQLKLREKTALWKKVWEKYELLMSTDKPSYETLEDAHRDLEGYKVFQMAHNEDDVAYQLAVAGVKRIAHHLGVSLGATVEEE